MMKLPTECFASSIRYTIEYQEFNPELDSLFQGRCNNRTNLITVSKDSPDAIRETLLHEWLHAMLDKAKLKQDEEFVSRLTPIMLSSLRDSPAMLDFLRARECVWYQLLFHCQGDYFKIYTSDVSLDPDKPLNPYQVLHLLHRLINKDLEFVWESPPQYIPIPRIDVSFQDFKILRGVFGLSTQIPPGA